MIRISFALFFLHLLCISIFAEEVLVAPGTYDNLLTNGNLELYGGDMPGGWRTTATRAEYLANGSPNGGGRFIFREKNRQFLIRQDWTFTLIPDETYRLTFQAKASAFKSARADIEVFNNGWTTSEKVTLPQGDTGGWKKHEIIFKGFTSNGNNYSVAIIVSNISSGSLEMADFCIEPATAEAQKKSMAFLDAIPRPDFVIQSPRLNRIPASNPTINCRWYGNKAAKSVNIAIGGKNVSVPIEAGGFVNARLPELLPGEYTLTATAGDYKREFTVTVIPGAPETTVERLNNFHSVLKRLTLEPGKTATFVNPRDGWVLFRLPAETTVSVAGSKHPLADGQFAQLPQGEHKLTVQGKGGPSVISAIIDASIYQLCGGPYLKGLAKHDWTFTKQYELNAVTTFYCGGLKDNELREFRKGNHHFYNHNPASIILNPKNDTGAITLPGMNEKATFLDGTAIDELSTGTLKNLVAYIQNARRATVPVGREIATYVTGNLKDSCYAAELLSTIGNFGGKGIAMFELYLPNIYANEDAVKEQISLRILNYMKSLRSIAPSAMPTIGIALCHSNIPFSFTIDNDPEADIRVLLDMQMQTIATAPECQNLGYIHFWGDNYSDLPNTRWVMELFRHYVFEGKTTSLAAERDMKLCPNHIANASFRNKLDGWTAEGDVRLNRLPNFSSTMKRFNAANDASDMVTFRKGDAPASLKQTATKLRPGRKYCLRYVTSGPKSLKLKLKGGKLLPEQSLTIDAPENPKRAYECQWETAVFQAETPECTIEWSNENSAPNSECSLHYVSLLPWLEN